ncbi:MAG: ATP-binding protein [Leptolinea sp.]|jgi:predicted AAA+ superfamily ATPase|nr:ATP-binding protein [Leptolinea sp.]
MIQRDDYLNRLKIALGRSPITALLGPRQCGKTTLAHQFTEQQPSTFFDIESVPDRRRLQNPEWMLSRLNGLVVLDEIQEMPELFPVLRVLVDRPENQARFLILGSASPEIIKSASETLAGRLEFIELQGFDLSETGTDSWETLWLRGGFPRSFLASSEEDSLAWREGFIRTYLERDIPQLGIQIPSITMRRFWTMLAHYHGQTWNASEIGRSMGFSDKTVRSYLDILTGTFMIRQLQPWFENLGKRQVKSPKIYFRDSGLLHSLLDIPDTHSLFGHPRVGASWEGFAIEQAMRLIHPNTAYFWGTHAGAELDLVFQHKGHRYGMEVKFNEAPSLTPSMRIASSELNLDHLWIIYPGNEAYPVKENITVLPLKELGTIREQFR